MKKVKIPRCFKKYKDDRICDLCNISKECDYEFKLEIEISQYPCKNRALMTGWFYCEDKTKMNKDGKKRIECKPDIFCFPKLLRREKLKKLKHINKI